MSLELTFLDYKQTFHMLLHAGLGQTAGAAVEVQHLHACSHGSAEHATN
jgi:hypothetical protein